MKNEEIEQRAKNVILDPICRDDFGTDDYDQVYRDIAQVIREAVEQAYEEAARIAETATLDAAAEIYEGANKGQDRSAVRAARIAHDIRALKDSLVEQSHAEA